MPGKTSIFQRLCKRFSILRTLWKLPNLVSRRYARSHHCFFVCARCYNSFENEGSFTHHCSSGVECDPHCVSSQCTPCVTVASGTLLSDTAARRHRKTVHCPADKRVSNRDRWQYLYHLRYPDRTIVEPSTSPHPCMNQVCTKQNSSFPHRPFVSSWLRSASPAKTTTAATVRSPSVPTTSAGG